MFLNVLEFKLNVLETLSLLLYSVLYFTQVLDIPIEDAFKNISCFVNFFLLIYSNNYFTNFAVAWSRVQLMI